MRNGWPPAERSKASTSNVSFTILLCSCGSLHKSRSPERNEPWSFLSLQASHCNFSHCSCRLLLKVNIFVTLSIYLALSPYLIFFQLILSAFMIGRRKSNCSMGLKSFSLIFLTSLIGYYICFNLSKFFSLIYHGNFFFFFLEFITG